MKRVLGPGPQDFHDSPLAVRRQVAIVNAVPERVFLEMDQPAVEAGVHRYPDIMGLDRGRHGHDMPQEVPLEEKRAAKVFHAAGEYPKELHIPVARGYAELDRVEAAGEYAIGLVDSDKLADDQGGRRQRT